MTAPTAVLLVLLGADPSPADAFVQASRLNVRAEPSASATLVGQVVIGTPCTVVERRDDGWVKLEAGAVTGWARGDLLGPVAPALSDLLSRGKDLALPAGERLNFALRAVALAPGEQEAVELARRAFVELEVSRASDASGPPRSKVYVCDGSASGSAEQCLERALGEELEGTATVVGKDGAYRVVVSSNRKCLGLTVGVLTGPQETSQRPGRPLFPGELAYEVNMVRRYELPMNVDLHQMAFGGPPADLPTCEAVKASRAALKTLPRLWKVLTRKKDGSLFRSEFCGWVDQVGLTGRSDQLQLEYRPPEGGATWVVHGVTHERGVYAFNTDKGRCTLEFPAGGKPELGKLDCGGSYVFDLVVPAKAARFPLEKSCPPM